MPYFTITIYIITIGFLLRTLFNLGCNLYRRWGSLNGLKETRITLFLVNLFLVLDLVMRIVPQYLHILPGIQTPGLIYYIPFFIIRILGLYSFYRFVRLFNKNSNN